jgi:hypothetical protein
MRVRVSDVGTQDVRFAWHHLQLWAEFYEGRFEVLRVGHADTFAYYVEAKYKFTPQLFGPVRWNQQLFGNVNDGYGGRVRWSSGPKADRHCGYLPVYDAYSAEAAYSFQQETTGLGNDNHLLAAQFTVRF